MEDPIKHEIQVTVSMSISKTFNIEVDDYEEGVGIDDSGKYQLIDYSNCDLIKAVNSQITLPTELPLFIKRIFDMDLDLKAAKMPLCLKLAINDCEDWNIDEIEVIHD
jgi:hypothetical protein